MITIKHTFQKIYLQLEEMFLISKKLVDPAFAWQPALASSSGSGKPTIRAGRRRPSGEGSGEREQAEAPRRRETPTGSAGQGYTGSGGGAGSTGGSSGLPLPSMGSGGKPNSLLTIVILVVLAGIAICGGPNLLAGLSPDGGQVDTGALATEPYYSEPAAPLDVLQPTDAFVTRPTSTPRPSTGTTAGSASDTWTVMLYQDADDKVLEQDIYIDLNEAERVGSGQQLNIVAQVDRYKGGYSGDGNWTSTKRFYVTQDFDLNTLGSQELDDLGEVNMSDADTLVDFVTWAVKNYPADKYALILSDHGMGWPGGWSDPDPVARRQTSTPLASAIGDHLYMDEMDQALAEIRRQTGIDKFELLGMDACLMGHLEVLSALEPHARYAVVSQETEPSLGWAYTSFLNELKANPAMNGSDLGKAIVASYIIEDQRIVDDQARAEFARPSGGLSGLFGMMSGPSASQLVAQLQDGITISAIDLEAIPALMDNFNDMAVGLQQTDQNAVAKARTYTRSYTSIFGSQVPPSYIDLGNFVQIVAKESGSSGVVQLARNTLGALQQAVIAEKHGPKKSGSTGISIYFPNSQLYRNAATGPQSYTAIADRFAAQSLWDDFLAYHYTGRSFEAQTRSAVVPESSVPVRAPGSGEIVISPIATSSKTATQTQPVLLSADILGTNIGHIYIFTGYIDTQARSINVADMDYLESGETREVDGVYYPVWYDGEEFTLEFEWEPLMFAISDGVNDVVTLLRPRSFGASAENAVYTVDGIYTFADGETRYARLYFSNGVLRQVYGYTNDEFTGSPREIVPQSGDQFTILESWMDLDASGRVTQPATQEGGTLTFGKQTFIWKEMWAAPGQYILGFMVEDLDGNLKESYTQVTVR